MVIPGFALRIRPPATNLGRCPRPHDITYLRRDCSPAPFARTASISPVLLPVDPRPRTIESCSPLKARLRLAHLTPLAVCRVSLPASFFSSGCVRDLRPNEDNAIPPHFFKSRRIRCCDAIVLQRVPRARRVRWRRPQKRHMILGREVPAIERLFIDLAPTGQHRTPVVAVKLEKNGKAADVFGALSTQPEDGGRSAKLTPAPSGGIIRRATCVNLYFKGRVRTQPDKP